MLVFEEKGKPENPEKNLSEQSRGPTTNSTRTHCMTPGLGIEPGTHWREACALSTVPTLLPGKEACSTVNYLYIGHFPF